MNLVCTIDDSAEYSARFNMPVQRKNNGGYLFEPELTVNYPGIASPRIAGSLLFIANRKIDFSLRLRNVFSAPAKATGSMTITNSQSGWKRELEMNVQTPLVSGKFEGFVDKQQSSGINSRGEFEWTDAENQQQKIIVSNKLNDLSSDTITKRQLET